MHSGQAHWTGGLVQRFDWCSKPSALEAKVLDQSLIGLIFKDELVHPLNWTPFVVGIGSINCKESLSYHPTIDITENDIP